MKLYFARHGQTESNLQQRVVSFGDQLTDLGRQQACELADRISRIDINLVISSPQVRTMETARIIAQKIGKNVQETPLLAEKKWPSVIEGKLLEDAEVKKFFELQKEKNINDPDWHYGDEENFADVKKRAGLFIDYVSKLPQANVLAVSHEYFIKTVIAQMMFGPRLTYELFRDFFHFTILDNVSLATCENGQGVWKLFMQS